MEEFIVQSVEETRQNGVDLFITSMVKPDGTMHHHIMPQAALQIRAAEYEHDLSDPVDYRNVIDILLHETFIPPEQDDESDPAFAAGYNTAIKGQPVAATLWTAETIKDAREAHRLRVDEVKKYGIRIKHSKEHREAMSHGAVALSMEEEAHIMNHVWDGRREHRGRGDGQPLKG